jgi:hypothetical protein
MSRMMDARRSFTVGLAVVAGTAVMLMPQLGASVPDWAQVVVQSGLTVGALVAIALNAMFRIGTRRTVRLPLDPAGEASQATEALEREGKSWGVRRDTVLRAGHAVGEALEVLRSQGVEGRITLIASFDEFNLVCVLFYRGGALHLDPGNAPDMSAALEADDAHLEALMQRFSTTLMARLADRVRGVQKGELAELRLSFDH